MTTAAVASRKLTYEDLRYWPEDGKRHELIDGEHCVTPAPIPRHQIVSGRLFSRVGRVVDQGQLGLLLYAPVDVVLSEIDVVEPDLVFIGASRLGIVRETHVQGAPDLVVEILSPSTRRRDEITKRHLYEQHGVPEYWVVDPELDAIKVYRLGDGGYRREAELTVEAGDELTSPVFPGLRVPLAEIFG
jgi:Uma2 family endonuclease